MLAFVSFAFKLDSINNQPDKKIRLCVGNQNCSLTGHSDPRDVEINLCCEVSGMLSAIKKIMMKAESARDVCDVMFVMSRLSLLSI